MKANESIRIGSIVEVWNNDSVARVDVREAEVIGFVVAGRTKIRLRYADDNATELRDDLTNDNMSLVTY